MNDIYPSKKDDSNLKEVEDFQYEDEYGRLKFKYIVVNRLNGRIKLFFFELLILFFLPLVLSMLLIIKGNFLIVFWAWSILTSFVIFLANKYYKISKFFTIALFSIFYFTISLFSIFYLVFSSFFYLITSLITLFFK
ncbi:hypothetical protein Thena_0375 [Thermodesulfobium narugense DSM 14796]|uniref:Uncharacterized protein n=1 Tax=Thermodesulfobium narugense DSM 14796 TaxID=747365 RepID=M1E548_9BACT|nr:hypothetical protein [Thermodesulfobium narugense]AEE14021.1 hypothetical protein Thena_0375 [Thermodesulfobium narugense DSM 14796]